MKNIGEKVLGWFIVQEDDDETIKAPEPLAHAASTRTDTVRSTSSGTAMKLESGLHPLPLSPSVRSTSFAEVYRGAGVPIEESDRLAKVLDLIASLPRDPSADDVRRSIVAAALQAFAVPVDRVVHTATASMAALDAHTESAQAQTDSLLAQARAQIAKLTEEIESLRRAMEAQTKKQDELRRVTSLEKQRLGTVVDFFGGRT